MTRNEQFFYEHAGYCYDPATETAEQGRARCAADLARAEQFARDHGWTAEWETDIDGCMGCECGSDECACFAGEPHETEICILYDQHGNILESLGGICGATREYRRVVEAELTLSAMHSEQSSELAMEVL